MARKVCTAGVVGSFSYLILEQEGTVVSAIRDENKEIVTSHVDREFATKWTERKLRELVGKKYETD